MGTLMFLILLLTQLTVAGTGSNKTAKGDSNANQLQFLKLSAKEREHNAQLRSQAYTLDLYYDSNSGKLVAEMKPEIQTPNFPIDFYQVIRTGLAQPNFRGLSIAHIL